MDTSVSNGSLRLGRRGLWFDAAVLAGNIFLLGPLSELSRSTQGFDPRFGVFLLVAVALYSVGAKLKRRPLQARLAAAKSRPMGSVAVIIFFVLMVMHLALFMLCAMVGAEMIHDTSGGGPPVGLWQNAAAAGLLLLGLVPTTMAVAAMVKPRTPSLPSPALNRRESVADLLLYASCMVILAWWNGSLAELFAHVQAALPMRILLVVLMTVPFSIFYLAPRVLFLFEDYRYLRTWIGVLVVMLPLALRVIFRQFTF